MPVRCGAVRDSKNPTGPVLPVGDLPTFVHEIKRGRLDVDRFRSTR